MIEHILACFVSLNCLFFKYSFMTVLTHQVIRNKLTGIFFHTHANNYVLSLQGNNIQVTDIFVSGFHHTQLQYFSCLYTYQNL